MGAMGNLHAENDDKRGECPRSITKCLNRSEYHQTGSQSIINMHTYRSGYHE